MQCVVPQTPFNPRPSRTCRRQMQHLSIPPTSLDRTVASAAARYTNPLIQNCARAATWAADAHVLGPLVAAAWVVSRARFPVISKRVSLSVQRSLRPAR